MFAVARWQKVLSKMKKLRGKDKLMAEILHKKFYFKYEEPYRMFWHKFFLIGRTFPKSGRTFWCEWPETYALTWQQC
jgi:hypothetical protein